MRILVLLGLILALAGCRMLRPELPPWARPVPATSEPAPEAPPEAEASVVPEQPTTPPATEPQPAPAPATPPPPPRPPAVTPAPAGPPPPPARAATPQPPAPASAPAPAHVPAAPPAPASPPLTASLPPAEARRLQEEAQRGIDDTEKLLRQLEGRPLAPKDLETLRLAQGLVEQARKALGGQEYERAANLAAKARTLADDLSTRR
jgi:outer membrane biosynthesis protein TonB